MPTSSLWKFTDPDEYTERTRAAKFDLAVTQAGYFEAKLTRIDLHRLWMQRFSENLSRVLHFECDPARAIISFATQGGSGFVHDGSELQPNSIMRHSRGHGGFQRVTGPAHFAAMSLPIADMQSLGANLAGCDFAPPKESLIITAQPTAMARLQRLHAAAGYLAEHSPEIIASTDAARGLEQALIAAMTDCLSAPGRHSSGNRGRARIMEKFFGILRAHPNDVIHLPELSAEIGASTRTLTTCCNKTLGMSAHRYLRVRQLNLVHRELASANPMATNVTQIATTYGFWELGRFAVAYRALFGEPLGDFAAPSCFAAPLKLSRTPAQYLRNLHSRLSSCRTTFARFAKMTRSQRKPLATIARSGQAEKQGQNAGQRHMEFQRCQWLSGKPG